MSTALTKDLRLLEQRVEMVELRGTVLESSTSHKTEVSGGGTTFRGQGSVSISSSTTSATKIFMDIAGREQSFTAPGDYELRKGHDISLMLARRAGREVAAGLINHSVNKSQWQSGAALAGALGIDVDYSKLAFTWRYLVAFIVPAWLGVLMTGEGSAISLGLATLAMFWIYAWGRKRTRTRDANNALDQFFRGR